MRKIFLSLTILLFFTQSVHAEHQWIWENDKITVYVEDTEIVWNDNGEEFSVIIIDIIEGKAEFNRLNFYKYAEKWYYGIVGKQEIMPVSYANASGNILDFAKNFLTYEKDNN